MFERSLSVYHAFSEKAFDISEKKYYSQYQNTGFWSEIGIVEIIPWSAAAYSFTRHGHDGHGPS